ncbi:MAG: hypothetical protein HRT68_12475, partial [Flavobacteriaceae bacterium]|nr:hypothetical protein [Flavobacteriaceae bacterium]
GNSWFYEYYLYDDFPTSTIPVLTSVTEEVTITGQTTIDGNEYFVFETVISGNDDVPGQIYIFPNSQTKVEYLRENSNGHLVNQNGFVYYPRDDFNFEQIVEQVDNIEYKQTLIPEITNINTAIGSFDCYKFEYTVQNLNTGDYAPGRSGFFYAESIGHVKTDYALAAFDAVRGYKILSSYDLN